MPHLKHVSTWWGLSGRAIEEILLHYHHNAHMRESFEFACIPEEQYFHTILGNSRCRFVARDFLKDDFSRNPAPWVFHTAEELRAARMMPFLFLRKVDMGSPIVSQHFASLQRE